MPNHFHLFLRTREANLSRFMQSLLTSFTVFVNRRDRSSGHIFQGRFKAQLVEGIGYFDILSRYIHLNPVRVKSARELPMEERRRLLAECRWSSFPALIGLVAVPGWLKADDILKGFGAQPLEQMKGYRLYVEEGLMREIEDPAEAAQTRSILGSDTFGDWVKREFLLKTGIRNRREQPELGWLHSGMDVRRVVAAVAADCGAHAPSLLRKGCRKRQARNLAILLCCRHGRGTMSLSRMAAMFNLSLSGLTSVRDRMERRLAGKSSRKSSLTEQHARALKLLTECDMCQNAEV
jgi:hypothetical protein